MDFFETVCGIIRSIPEGSVMSYGQVAALAGHPRMARQVGWALHRSEGLPWQRVVRSDGSIAVEAYEFQRALLEAEGVLFDEKGRVRREFFAMKG